MMDLIGLQEGDACNNFLINNLINHFYCYIPWYTSNLISSMVVLYILISCIYVSFIYLYNITRLFSDSCTWMPCLSIFRITTIHICYNNSITGENLYSKLSLVDLAGSEGLVVEDDSGERVTDLLHVMKSLSAYVVQH